VLVVLVVLLVVVMLVVVLIEATVSSLISGMGGFLIEISVGFVPICSDFLDAEVVTELLVKVNKLGDSRAFAFATLDTLWLVLVWQVESSSATNVHASAVSS
jgi:hypothetical protein